MSRAECTTISSMLRNGPALIVSSLLVGSIAVLSMTGCVVPSGDASPTAALNTRSVRDLADPALRAVDADPEQFGGAFLDRSHSQLHVLYVGDEASARGRLQQHLPPELRVTWVQVEHSSSELQRVRAAAIEFWEEVGIEAINSVSVHAPENQVIVSLPTHDPALVAELRNRHGSALAFRVEAPDQPAD